MKTEAFSQMSARFFDLKFLVSENSLSVYTVGKPECNMLQSLCDITTVTLMNYIISSHKEPGLDPG